MDFELYFINYWKLKKNETIFCKKKNSYRKFTIPFIWIHKIETKFNTEYFIVITL